MTKRATCFALLTLTVWTLTAQTFRISLDAPRRLGRRFTLLVYDTDSLPRVLTPAYAGDGSATFAGTVATATYAELRHRDVARPLPLFVDNANIAITYDADNPAASHITGSRSNSMLRYQMELCDGDVECLTRYVEDNPASPLAPYIADQLVAPTATPDEVARLLALLSGEATTAYHYRQLQRRLRRMEALAAGSPFEGYTFTDTRGKTHQIDTLLSDSVDNIIVIGATWCSQCKDIEQQIKQSFPTLNTIAIAIDSVKGGWDAPLMRQLDVETIPHLILVDSGRRLVARDLRVWQLRRALEGAGQQ